MHTQDRSDIMQWFRDPHDTVSEQEPRQFHYFWFQWQRCNSLEVSEMVFLSAYSGKVSITDIQLHMWRLGELHPGQLSDYRTMSPPEIWFNSKKLCEHWWHT